MDRVEEKTFKVPIEIIGEPSVIDFPKPFRHPSLICISGTTGAGKTTWIYNFFLNIQNMFQNETPTNVLYCYGVYQDLFDVMESELEFITFHEGVPNKETILELKSPSMIILDDLAHNVCKNTEMELLFSQMSHHRNISVCFMKNNLFYQGKNARTITLNTNIFVLMKNPSDSLQIKTLAKRIFPNNYKEVLEAYSFAIKLNNGKGYLIIDLLAIPTTDIIMKTGIFPNEEFILFKV